MKVRIRLCLFCLFLVGFAPINAWKNETKIVHKTPVKAEHKHTVRSEKDIFVDSVKCASKRLKVPYKWFLAICYNESMFDPKAKNKRSSATGIIQFTNAAAKEVGTTTGALKKMTCIQQVKYAERFFSLGIAKYGQYQSLTDMYLWCLLPNTRVYANQPYKTIMQTGDKFYGLNSGLDEDKNGKVQVFEITNRMNRKIKKV